ncbi:MAG TPA: hypothetical protein VME66_14095 [Candidatus Acidoferrales bacterium]|nr:hypothetical protein [Candidatus Acidoferrales bacterium]
MIVPLVLALITVSSSSAPTSSAPTSAPVPISPEAAVIVNSGSTNTAGFSIVVSRSGDVTVLAGSTTSHAVLSPVTTRTFFHDLSGALPLGSLEVARCMKSASFGTTTRVLWQGQSTPDLSCPATSATGTQLSHDITAIENQIWGRLHTLPVHRRLPTAGS